MELDPKPISQLPEFKGNPEGFMVPGYKEDTPTSKVDIGSAVRKCSHVALVDSAEGDLELSDEFGNVLARFEGGHIQTKEFDSRKTFGDISSGAAEAGDLELSDEFGNVLARFEGGHIRTKEFDSRKTFGDISSGAAEAGDLELSDEFGNVLARFEGGHIQTKEFDSRNASRILLNPHRKASVSFIFDDGTSTDVAIHDKFSSLGVNVGWAIYGFAQRYKDYAEGGDELLAHAVSSMATGQSKDGVISILKNQKAIIEDNYGVRCHGWVTPSSILQEEYRYLIDYFYDYGYSQYRGDIYNPPQAALPFSEPTYNLWRTNCESIRLQQAKDIIDYAAKNDKIVCFYGHSARIASSQLDVLADIVSYCRNGGIPVVVPHLAVADFYSIRHNDFFNK